MRTTSPALRDAESRQQVFQRDVLRLHCVAAGLRRQPRLGKFAEAARDVGIRRRGVKCLERGTVHDQLDRHLVRPAHALEMISDIAQHEGDLVEIAEVVDDLRLVGIGRGRARALRGGRHQRARCGEGAHDDAASVHRPLHRSGEGEGAGPSLAPHGGEFLAIGHQRPALLEAGAVESEHAVVRTAAERKSILIGLVVAPDADSVEPDLG